MPRIFISYRRADTQAAADRLYKAFVAAFGKESVFKDVDSIRLAQDFRAAIEKAIILSDILLVVIGPQWLTIADDAGQRRLDNPADYVRLEVEFGMRHARAVIPVLIDGAQMPSGDQLPPSLYQLSYFHGAVLRAEPDTEGDIARLIAQVSGLSPAAKAADEVEDSPPPQEPQLEPAPAQAAPQSAGESTAPTLPKGGIDVKRILLGGHEVVIDLAGISLTKPQRVWYDGTLVSEHYTIFGVTHKFTVLEDGVQTTYEVQTGSRWHGASYWIIIRRNGVVAYTNK